MKTLLRISSFLMLVGFFFTKEAGAQGVSNYNYNFCKNEVKFRLRIGVHRNVGGTCKDYSNEYHNGDGFLDINGTRTKVFELDWSNGNATMNGWKKYLLTGKDTRTVFIRAVNNDIKVRLSSLITKEYDDDCTVADGDRFEYDVDFTIEVPDHLSGEGQSMKVLFGGHWDAESSNYQSWESPFETLPSIPRVSGIVNAEPVCDGVLLSWDKPSFSCTNASFVIHRNGVYQKAVNFNTLEWKDTNVTFNETEDYKYEVFVRHNSSDRDFGLPSSVESNPILNFDSPDYFESVKLETSNLCSQSIRLQWEINDDVDIDYFEVERDETNQFTNPIINTVTQTFGTIPFDDQDIPVNQDYYYRIKAYDNCQNEVYIRDADVQHILFEGPPSNPRIENIETATDGSDKATINWSYPADGTPVDYYQVYRDGSPRSEKLPPTTFTYEDDGLSNCLEFEYMVVAGKECFDEANSMRVRKVISFNTDLNGFKSLSASKYYYNDRITLIWDTEDDNGAEEVVIYRNREGSEDTPEILKRMPINSSSYDDFDTDPGVLYRYGLLAVSCPDYQPTLVERAAMMTSVGIRSETGIINGKITYEGGNAVEDVRVIATPSDGENRGVSLGMKGNQLTIPLEKEGASFFPEEWTLSFWFRLHDKAAGQTLLDVSSGSNYLTLSPLSGGQTEFYDIDYQAVSAIEGVQDVLVGYEQDNGDILSRGDATILGKIDEKAFIEYRKTAIAGRVSNDTLYDFQTNKPWLLNQADEWFELFFESTSIATPDSLIGYLDQDTLYDAYDSDFVLAFIDEGKLVLANHFNISYELGAPYAHISEGELVFANDPETKGNIVGDFVYTPAGDPIHMIVGDNIFYVYRDELTGKLVRGKHYARMVPNDTDPDIPFDVFLITDIQTEAIQKGAVLGTVSSDKTKVYEVGGLGLVHYLIDENGVLRTAKYQDADVYVPKGDALYQTQGGMLVEALTGLESYLFNTGDSLYSIELRQGSIDETGFVQDDVSNEYMYYLEEAFNGDRLVYRAIGQQVNYIINDTTDTYYKEAYQAQVRLSVPGLSGEEAMLSPELYLGEYNNLLMTYDGQELTYFVNGVSVDTVQVTGLNQLFQDQNALVFGGYDGLQDETLLWSKAKDSLQVTLDFNRYLSGGEDDLIGYWRIDESVGLNVYDASYTLGNTGEKVFNERHATIDGAQWSNIVPEQEDLSFTAFTNADGNYSIQSIIYAGSGNNFKVVPILGTHRFEPNNKILFLGPSQKVQNEQDFRDKSAFRVTGTVKYDPLILGFTDQDDPSAPNCYVEGVQLYIDNQPVLENENFVTTDENGRFEIDVPIGKHQISVRKDKHTFYEETWPSANDYNFQGDVNDLVFYDNTTRTLIGKVVGGTTEGGKITGSGTSINNVGVAEIELKSIGKTCFETIIETDPITGEYIAELPPFRYNIVGLSIPSQTNAFNYEYNRLAEASIDLSRDNLELDSVTCEKNCNGVDWVRFHLKRDFIHRNSATFTVKQYRAEPNEEGEWIEIPHTLGAESATVTIDNNGTLENVTLDLTSNSPFPRDLFTVGSYTWGITLSENYENRDAQALDPSAPIQHYYDTIRSGNILIENDIAGESVELSLEDGEVKYTFLSGAPSLLVDRQNPELSFTKAVQIIGPNSTWGDTEGIYRGIVLGDVLDNTQNSFYTISDVADYQVINMILRDPPGSKSYSEFERNLKLTKIRSSTFKSGLQQGGTLMAGSLFAINMGNSFIESTVVKYQHLYGGKWNTSQHRETSERSKLTFEEGVKIATSSENKNTGAGSDIFVGNALNLFCSTKLSSTIGETLK